MRTGLFLSRDDGMVSQTVDVDFLASQYDNVDVCKVYDNFYKPSDLQDMLETIRQKQLNAVVLAGNSPKYFQTTPNADRLLDSLDSLGVNRNKVEFANIREQVAFPHRGDPAKATEKARSLIDVALAKVQLLNDVRTVVVAPRKVVLVLGATPAGIITTSQLLDKGYKVFLVDRQSSFRKDQAVEPEIKPSLALVTSDPNAKVLFNANVKDISGWCGDYQVILEQNGYEEVIDVGGIILSVGGDTEWIAELKPRLQLDIDAQGFIRSPKGSNQVVRTADPGVLFVPVSKNISRFANDAANAAIAVLSLTTMLEKNEIIHFKCVTSVNEVLCGGCGTCVKTCAFGASKIDLTLGLSSIDVRRCKGCGNCVVSCPTGARNLVSFPGKTFFKAGNELAEGIPNCDDPKILAILCSTSGYPAADCRRQLAADNRKDDLFAQRNAASSPVRREHRHTVHSRSSSSRIRRSNALRLRGLQVPLHCWQRRHGATSGALQRDLEIEKHHSMTGSR